MKIILWVVGILVLLIGGFFALNSYIYHEKQGDSPAGIQEEKAPESPRFDWVIAPSSRHEETMPWEEVYLFINGEEKMHIGEYLNCDGLVTGALERYDGAVSVKTCWFGGGGNDFGVFFENGAYVVKVRETSESGGPEVRAEPYGPWKTLTTIDDALIKTPKEVDEQSAHFSTRAGFMDPGNDFVVIQTDAPYVNLNGWSVRKAPYGAHFRIQGAVPVGATEPIPVILHGNAEGVFIKTVGSQEKNYVGEGLEYHLYFGYTEPAWKEHGTLELLNPEGVVIDTYTY